MANSDDVKKYLHDLLLVNNAFSITDMNSFIRSNGTDVHKASYEVVKNLVVNYHRLCTGAYTNGEHTHVDYISQIFSKLDNHTTFVVPPTNNNLSTYKITNSSSSSIYDSFVTFQPKTNIASNQLNLINELQQIHTNFLTILSDHKDQLKNSISIAEQLKNILIFLKIVLYLYAIDILHPTDTSKKGQHINNIKNTVNAIKYRVSVDIDSYNEMSKNISTLTVNNKIIDENKDRYNDTMNIITTREHIKMLQMYEFYIAMVILFMVVLMAVFLNNDKRTYPNIKYLIIVCILITLCVYLMDNFFINGREIEKFTSDKGLYITNVINEIKNYGDILKKNIDTRDILVDNIKTNLDREVRKNTLIKESSKNMNANVDGIYSEMYRDTITYQETLYFVIYLIIISLLLNVYFVELSKYWGDTDYVVAWTMWTFALLVGFGTYFTKYYYRTRPDSIKFDFVKPSD